MPVNAPLLLDLAKTIICLFFLSAASLQDIKSREVSDTIWVIFAPAGLALTLISIALSGWDLWVLFRWVIVIAITSSFSIALFYLGLFGGADSKALICLAVAMPFRPNLPLIELPLRQNLYVLIPPPISSFNNAVTFAALSAVPILIRNLVDYVRSGEIFGGLEHERLFKKILALLTGYRVNADKLRFKKHFYFIMEEFMKCGDGSTVRKLRIFSRLPVDEDSSKEYVPPDFHGKVWVTPGLPFIVFITLGFLTALFIGDIIFMLPNVMLTR